MEKDKYDMDISIVVPVYNSQETLPVLYNRLVSVLQNLGKNHEIIFVNDGSRDNSLGVIEELCSKDSHVKLIEFSRNFGHQAAISAGLQYSSGSSVVIMDDDLQDPPEVLPEFLKKLKEGHEVVYGIRKNRKEGFLLRLGYYIFYRALKIMSSWNIPVDAGDFCVMDRKIVNVINSMEERNKFLRGIRSYSGFRQVGLEYERQKRLTGKSGYTSLKYLRFAIDGVLSFSYVPLKLATIFGFFTGGFSFIYGTRIIILKISGGIENVPGFAALFVAITFIGAVQLISIGIIGEYLSRIYDEVKRRPNFIIQRKMGFRENDKSREDIELESPKFS